MDDIDEAWLGIIAEQYPAVYGICQASELSHSKGMKLHRVMKDTGSIWLHCDPTASHYLKLVMDAIFGSVYYLNEVI